MAGVSRAAHLCLIESICSQLSMVLFPHFPVACYGKRCPVLLVSSPCSLLTSSWNSQTHGVPPLCSSAVLQSPSLVLVQLAAITDRHYNLTEVRCQADSQGSAKLLKGIFISSSLPSGTGKKWGLCQVFPSFMLQSFRVWHKLESTFLWNKNKVGIFTVSSLPHWGIVVFWIIKKSSNDQFSKYRFLKCQGIPP